MFPVEGKNTTGSLAFFCLPILLNKTKNHKNSIFSKVALREGWAALGRARGDENRPLCVWVGRRGRQIQKQNNLLWPPTGQRHLFSSSVGQGHFPPQGAPEPASAVQDAEVEAAKSKTRRERASRQSYLKSSIDCWWKFDKRTNRSIPKNFAALCATGYLVQKLETFLLCEWFSKPSACEINPPQKAKCGEKGRTIRQPTKSPVPILKAYLGKNENSTIFRRKRTFYFCLGHHVCLSSIGQITCFYFYNSISFVNFQNWGLTCFRIIDMFSNVLLFEF